MPQPSETAENSSDSTQSRCGHVVLIGVPNSGKSTLFNALVGESLSIITPWSQTTQRPILGILTRGSSQLLFLDAPGVMRPRDVLQRSLLAGARAAAGEADVSVIVVDPLNSMSEDERTLVLSVAGEGTAPRIGVVNKIDAADPTAVERERRWLEGKVGARVHLVSGKSGAGLTPFLDEVAKLLPASPFLYPEGEIASDPVRFFVAERVREAIFEQFRDEIPYASFCEIQDFREGNESDRTYIQAVVYVEKRSQKGILIGQGGTAIRTLGTAARAKIEHFLQEPVYLDLWVKVLPNWRRKRSQLLRFGLPVPEEDDDPTDS